MMKVVRLLLLPLALAAARLAAQLAAPSPLVDAPVAAPGGWIVAEGRADSALQAGFPATAAGIYRDVLRDEALPAETRHTVTLALATALLDAGDVAEAEKTLQNYVGPRGAAYQLRVGLIAANSRRMGQAKAALAAGKPEELSAADKGWWYFLQGLVADDEKDFPRRDRAYEEANKVAVSELQRSRFLLGQEQAKLRLDTPTEAQLATYRSNMEKLAGQSNGYIFTRTYAIALALLNRKTEALAVLQRQLLALPPSERGAADQFRLFIGLIAGADSVTGRRALSEILAKGSNAETQRLALQLLTRGAKTLPERQQLRRELGDLIGAPVQHPIIEDLLLVRAQVALIDKEYAAAEEDARALLDRYPETTLRAAALGVRLSVAWDLKRYRTAADLVAQLRAALSPGTDRAELGVLLAEAFFRAADYKNAADAYDAALHELPAVVPAGTLIFQRVLADIRADQLDSAAKQLDAAATNPGFDPVNRWRAEWNLVTKMQVSGQAPAAYTRVNRLLAGAAEGVPDELRIRLMWLRAKLSYDNEQFDQARQQADELLGLVDKSGQLDAALRTNVTSMAQLLKAQALLKLKHDKEGLDVIERLRKDHGATLAAQYSYLIQASYLTERGDIAAAQVVLVSFVDNPAYKHSEYAPLALYEAALNLERQGLDRHLRDAYEKMLERLIHDYPQDELVFYALLKEGDILRRLNDIGAARQIYEHLVNNPTYAQHPDLLLAQIALADTLSTQGTSNVINYENAVTIYERLRDLESAPVDLRAEAGFKWGNAWKQRGQPAKAQPIFWSVVDAFLLDPAQAAKLGAKGRYWVSKALLELAQIQEDAGQLDEAQRAYQLIVDNKLYGVVQAQAKLARFRPSAGAKP